MSTFPETRDAEWDCVTMEDETGEPVAKAPRKMKTMAERIADKIAEYRTKNKCKTFTNNDELFHACVKYRSSAGGRNEIEKEYGNVYYWQFSEEVTEMKGLFSHCNFNEDITQWDTRHVKSMRFMFTGNRSFNQPIGGWNVGNVEDMAHMFSHTDFDQDISKWVVRNVKDMEQMFCNNHKFNQIICWWNVSNVRNFGGIFDNSEFCMCICNWKVDESAECRERVINQQKKSHFECSIKGNLPTVTEVH